MILLANVTDGMTMGSQLTDTHVRICSKHY